MLKQFLVVLCFIVILFGCNDKQQQDDGNVTPQNKVFNDFKERFLEEFWKHNPSYGVFVGYYRYDDRMIVPDAASRENNKIYINSVLAQLDEFDARALSPLNAADLALIRNQMEASLWYQETFKAYQWDPSDYNVGGIFGLIINTDYKPQDERLRSISSLLDHVPDYYDAAIQNITQPTIEHTELAIQQNKGTVKLLQSSFENMLELSHLTQNEREVFNYNLEYAIYSVQNYVDWLQSKLDLMREKGSAKNFRIGEEKYEEKFKFDVVSDYTAKELFGLAVKSKEKLHAEMIEITQQLWPKYFAEQTMPAAPLVAVKQLIEKLSTKHVARENFVSEVKRQMPIIEKYIIENDLLEMDATRPLVVRETPEYQRGIAGASVNAPGPYDATANTYYNVTPLDAYSDVEAESYLREYNHWILQILNIHEAMPGHYTQLMHANKSPSKIKSIFANGAMIEGWAVYAERMMLESGYAQQEPEMWLMYNKWNLRVVVNTILDYSVQVLDMSQADAMNLLMNEAFQEQTEAEGKWRRATLSQVQLTSYFNGYAEIYAFREELKKKLGNKFNLKDFHNQFLSYGNAPVPVIRKLMMQRLGLK